MIDQFALALGHGLLAVALLRLALRGDVDADPLVGELAEEAAARRRAQSSAGRKAARRAAQAGDIASGRPGDDEASRTEAAKRSGPQAAQRGATSRPQAAKR